MTKTPPTVRVNRDTLLASLAACGARIMFSASVHDVSREVFDSVRGQTRYYEQGDRRWWSKDASCGGLDITLYTNEPESDTSPEAS